MRQLPSGTVTLLFTDIEGSTHLLQQLGADYARLLQACRALMRALFHQFHGHEVDTQGDAFFVAFARASDAVAAAVAAQRALASHPWPQDATVRVRMGLHTGEPSQTAEGYVGLDVHLAARIMSASHGGQVLLSQTTHDLVEQNLPEGVSLHAMGTHRLKDMPHSILLFQLLITGCPHEFPAIKTLDASPNNLPLPLTPLIGREQEIRTLHALLNRKQVRLLTLTGPGGTGKTRLGLQVVAEQYEPFPDGVYFVDLAPVRDPEMVLATIAQTLALRETRTQRLSELLTAYLRHKHLLLLLDNFEQVLAAASHVANLLVLCPHLKIVVTSRTVLHVQGEQEFAVPSLTVPDPKHLPDLVAFSQYEAVTLFIQRTQAVKPDFQVTNANAAAVAEICIRLDGLPLAIELAAARSKLLPPQALLARLGHRLAILTSGSRDVPMRQQTLRNTIAWSYDLLDADEQRLFRRLSIFVGGCTFEAIETLCTDLDGDNEAGRILDRVASLLDKSLLRQREQEGEEPRLWMLETIREYGLECLTASEERETARQAHAAYYLARAEEAAQGFRSSQQAEWLEQLAREHDNLRAALFWSLEPAHVGPHLEMAFRFGEALGDFWWVRGFYSEGRAFLEQALARTEAATPSVRASALFAAAGFASVLGGDDLKRAEALYQESLTLYRALEDTRGIASSLMGLGEIAFRTGSNFAAASALFEESLSLYREVGDKEAIARVLVDVASADPRQQDYNRVRSLFEESLTLFRELGDKRGMAVCLRQSAMLLFSYDHEDQETMRARLEESLAISRELGDKDGLAFCSWLAGSIALTQGDTDTAAALGEQSLAHWQEIGDQWWAISALALRGRIETQRGDFVAARAFHEKSLASARAFHDDWFCALSLEGLASTVAAQGEEVWAGRLWGAAEVLREWCGVPIFPVERAEYESAVAAVRTRLSEQVFVAAWAEGRSMTLDQVLRAPG